MFIRQTLIFFVAVKTFFFLKIVSIRQFVVFHLVNEPGVYNYEIEGALDSQPQVIKFTSCLPMVGGSLRVLRLLPPLKLAVMI
jgi:hypothetical protein